MKIFKTLANALQHGLTVSTQKSETSIKNYSNFPEPLLETPVLNIYKYEKNYCKLPLKLRILATLRSAYHSPSRTHLLTALINSAKDYGLFENELYQIKQPFNTKGWTKEQQLLILVTDDINLNGSIRDQLWNALTEKYTQEQIISLLLCILSPELLT